MVSAAQNSDQIEHFRQGFVGYANVDGRQWRVLVRLRLEDEAWWRGRLGFSGAGGTGGGGKEGLGGRGPGGVRRQGRGPSPAGRGGGVSGVLGRRGAGVAPRGRFGGLGAAGPG